jgi:hypothetical protein
MSLATVENPHDGLFANLVPRRFQLVTGIDPVRRLVDLRRLAPDALDGPHHGVEWTGDGRV